MILSLQAHLMFRKKLSQKRKQRNQNSSYSSLEPRLLLSADIDPARNLVDNGNFESLALPEFVAFSDDDPNNTHFLSIRNLSSPMSRVVELDSIFGNQESLRQIIDTETGRDYVVSFDLRGTNGRAGDTADTNDVEVIIGGQSFGTFTGIDRWQTINIGFVADSDTTSIEFRESSIVSDGRGIFLDHISVTGIHEITIDNGSLETVGSQFGDGDFVADEVPGFGAIGTDRIGIATNTDAFHGSNALALNATTQNDRVYQAINTEDGGSYFATFAIRDASPGNDVEANVRVRWNNQHVGSFVGTSEWQTYGVHVQSDSDLTALVFREAGAAGPNDVQIDDVHIYRIDSLTSDLFLDLNGNEAGRNNRLDYIENSETNVTEELNVANANGSTFTSATARILNYTGSETLVANTSGTRIQASFNDSNGILRLVGRDSFANYRNVLRSLTFVDSNDDPTAGERQVLVSVADRSVVSERSEATLDVIPVNDAPVLTALPDVPLSANSPLTVSVGAIDPDDPNLNFSLQVNGDTEIFGDSLPTISAQGQIQLEALFHGSADITVTATDGSGETDQFTFNVDVPFTPPSGPIPDNFVPFSGQRQLAGTTPSLRNNIYDSAPAFNINTAQNYWAYIETADGEIVIDLFENDAPLTVNNFVNLALDGFYDGVTFHRVIQNFVAQGGDPTGTGSGGPGYQFVDELNNGHEFDGFGQLAMANSGPNTNGSQFFFTLNNNPAFAGEHTIFGEVVSGADVLNSVAFTNGSNVPEVIQRIRIEIT